MRRLEVTELILHFLFVLCLLMWETDVTTRVSLPLFQAEADPRLRDEVSTTTLPEKP